MQSPSIHLPRIRRRFPRVIVASVAAALLGFTGLLLPGVAKAATQICSNQTGTESGYYYSLWENGTGSACLTYNGSATPRRGPASATSPPASAGTPATPTR